MTLPVRSGTDSRRTSPRSSPRPGWRPWSSTTGNLGASDGEPRYEIDPWAQVRDYRDAITYLQSLPGIDRDRIGVWGSSSAAPALKTVVSQVPLINGFSNVQRLVRSDFLPGPEGRP